MKLIALLILCNLLWLSSALLAQNNLEASSPRIITQPEPVNQLAGSPLLLRVDVGAEPGLRFQWFRDGALLPGATNQEFGIYRAGPLDSGVYRLVVSNTAGNVQTEEIRVQIQSKDPVLEAMPASAIYPAGTPLALPAMVAGTPPFTYEWLRNGTNFSNEPILSLPALGAAQSGEYQLIIHNAGGSVTSQVFTVGYDLHQEPLRLSMQRSGEDIVLDYSYGENRGWLAIHSFENTGDFSAVEWPVYEQPINGYGRGQLILAGAETNTAQFFKASIFGSTTNPAPEKWTTVPASHFMMGSSATEEGRDSDEGPVVAIEFSQPVFMARWEVTQGEFLEIMGFNPSATPGDLKLPVEQVSWEEAAQYCDQLTQRDRETKRLPPGYEYRLPTEAEWEYAARAGSTNRFSFGDDPELRELEKYAWYLNNSGEMTHPVGSKLPNAWGLYDMHGNVAEWCADFYGVLPERSVTDPQGPRRGTEHVMRGGSFSDEGEYCRSAFRMYDGSTNAFANVGFRVVMAPLRALLPRTSPALVWISPGEFLMGSPPYEQDRQADEGPRTRVKMSQGYFMGRYEVTQGEFESVMGNNPSADQSFFDQPVDQVSWSEAMQFCEKLTELERVSGRLPAGYRYRLPTEAEWEYAARAGSTTRFYFGDDPDYEVLENYGWFMGASVTHWVGAKLPNAWGLYDVYGNVWEWCLDDYLEYAGGQTTNPLPIDGDTKIMRGGSSFDEGEFCRSACRMYGNPNSRYENVGFRVVLAQDTSISDVGPDMIWVSAGSFQMGSPNNEKDRETDEGPMNVTLSHGFWLGRFEVSQAEYEALMGTNTSHYQGWLHRPVESVTWDEAMEYCRRLTELHRVSLPEGYVYRLPTEAEWEYAARAGTTTRFSYGDDLEAKELSQYAHFLVGPTGGVGGKRPNSWGFYDMHGNVFEWCLDRYTEYSGGTVTDPWVPLTSHDWVVCRGGSVADAAQYCRSAFRNFAGRGDRDYSVGFRVALARQTLEAAFEHIVLVPIPAGQFLMGSPTNEVDHEFDESPQTQVTFSTNFWISAYEITQAQYQSLMKTNPSWFSSYGNLPVESVTWDEANEFCRKLTELEAEAGRLPQGYAYRLPTEAEWEYAARAGSTNRFSHGDDPGYFQLAQYAWHAYLSQGTTHGIGAKQSNAWGLYDIYGNVAEWCHDGYGPYPGGQVIDPTGPLDVEYRVMRGGSFYDTGELCRSAFRLYDWTGDRFYNVGFRVVLAKPINP